MHIYVNGARVPFKHSLFKGGEVFLELGVDLQPGCIVTVESLIRNSDGLMLLMSALQLIEEAECTTYLVLPYMPYARQDRKMNDRQANQSRMFWKLLSAYRNIIRNVAICDVHSPASVEETYGLPIHVAPQLVLLAHEYRSRFQWISECDAIVAPDKGAYNKAAEVARHFRLPLIVCTKVRAPSGEIIETTVEGDTEGKSLVIVDDIVDGGRTFLGIADKIQNAKELNLVCTHGIFSYGKEILFEKFNRVEAVYDWTTLN